MKSKFDYNGGKVFLTVVAVAVVFLISATQARAQSELELISGTYTETVMGVSGFASYDDPVGSSGWTVNVTTGLAIPTAAPGTIDLSSVNLNSTGAADSLTILWSGDGYTQTGDYTAAVGGTLSAGITATYTSYYGSLLSTTTPLTAPITIGPYGSSTAFSQTSTGTEVGAGPFALTEEIVISGVTSPSSLISGDFNVLSVPEPSPVVLLLTGGTALAMRRWKAKKSGA